MAAPCSARHDIQQAVFSLCIIFLCLAALLAAAPPAWAETKAHKPIVGAWLWNQKNLDEEALKAEPVVTTLTFNADGSLEVMELSRDGIGPGMGEGLGDGGHYRFRANRLAMTSSADPQYWPTDSRGGRIRYDCRIAFAPDASSFRLTRCPIAGIWLRVKGTP